MAIATMRVPTIFTAVDRFSDVVSKMTKKTALFGETTQAAAMRTSRKFNDVGTSMLASGVGMAVGIGMAVNEAVKFEKAMANVSTTIDSTPELMQNMSDSVLRMANKIPVPISQLTEALYDVVSAGIDAKDSMFVLEQSSLLAVSGLGTAKEGVDIITSALNSFNLKATESANVANMVFKAVKYGKTTVSGLAESFGSSSALIKNANVSLAEYLATTAVLTTTGMTASRAQTQISSAVTALIKPSGTMSKIFKRLGVKDVPAFIKSSGGLVNSMKIVSNEANRMGVLTSKAFGRKEGFSAMLSLLGPLSEKYKTVMGDIIGGTDAMTEAVAKQQKTFSAQFQLMKNKVVSLGIAIGNELMPRISGFLNTLSPIITSFIEWTKNNEYLATTLLNITTGLLVLGGLAKIGAVLFYGISQAIKVYTFVTKTAAIVSGFFAMGLEGMAIATTYAAASLYTFITTAILTVAPILAIVGALVGLVYMMYKSSQTTKAFAQNNTIHLKTVAGQYETMESRIARSNERIVASMKKLKLDLESVKNTGKTIAETRLEDSISIRNAYEKQKQAKAFTRSIGSTFVEKNKFIPDPKKVAINDVQSNYNEYMNGRNIKTYVDNTDKKGEITIVLKGNTEQVSSVNGTGNYIFTGIPVHTSSTKK